MPHTYSGNVSQESVEAAVSWASTRESLPVALKGLKGPAMTDAKVHRGTQLNARRNLRGLIAGTSKRIFPGYHSFELGEAPAWWRSELAAPEWGPVIGVFDRSPGCDERVVIAEHGLAVLANDTTPSWVSYVEVDHFPVLSKEPPTPSLPVWLRDGRLIQLPFTGGHAFVMMSFLLYAESVRRAPAG